MKTVSQTLLLIIMISIAAIACKKDNIINGNVTLSGRWLHIGGYISNGGPQYWVKATKKNYIQFNTNGTMKWDGNNDFNIYRLKDSVTLKMSNADSSKYEDYYYHIGHDTLLISPRAPIVCYEGCSTVFVKEK